MTTTCVIGVQWGDEGKGKIVDLLAEDSDMVVRYQGGGNAGHTVVVNGEKFVLHLIPSGILHRGTSCVIANGVVVDADLFLQEVEQLRARGILPDGRLFIGDRAHLVMPYHKTFDALTEEDKGETQIGTTRRGIGPCYADKAARVGLRVADLYNPARFRERLLAVVAEKNRILKGVYGKPEIDGAALAERYLGLASRLEPFVTDAVELVNRAIDEGRRVMFEGAQGSMLDLDFGTYPYVTSSNSDACGVPSGAGVSPKKVHSILGVAKAYTTRVGAGPFPTELTGEAGERLRAEGQEYGATTGRPRRCGWFDGVVSLHAVLINGIDRLAITKLDVLSGQAEIRVCTGYRLRGKVLRKIPADLDLLAECEPVYEAFPGWTEDLSACRRYEDLPSATRRYLQFIESFLGVRIELISVGSGREHIIYK